MITKELAELLTSWEKALQDRFTSHAHDQASLAQARTYLKEITPRIEAELTKNAADPKREETPNLAKELYTRHS